MKGLGKILSGVILFLIVLIGPLSYLDVSAQTCPQWIARVVSVQGDVQAKRGSETEWKATRLMDEFCPGDTIRVMEKSRAAVVLVNGVIVRLDQYSTMSFKGVEKEASLVEIIKGMANFFSRWPRSLKVYTPFVNGTVEGTEFFVRVDDDRTLISVFEGKVVAMNNAGSLTLTDGKSAITEAGKSPAPYLVVRPRDAVLWALYYPPVIYQHPEEFKENDPRFHIRRASSLLHVGRVNEANADIEKSLSVDPNNSEAFALQSIIAVARNEKEKASSLAKKAVEAGPGSAAARLALSYAKQARFDLKGALGSLKEAVKVEPANALAWARLAEIQSSSGELDDALKSANKAVELNPGIARAQTVVGFTYLTEVEIKQAREAFEKAVRLDQADPMPRLGLGLAKIRDGNLVEGRREIEIAVSLDPDNSLIRSYLGKAYFEEKRDKMADAQYSLAEELDPKDPTPYFYEAIKKQTENRPVEALEDMQKAIELNDNRAVYRSKFLLDADLAARSAGLARIYSDLDFQDLALVEGWKSINADPADFSGHRFLSDSYSALPRHEIARVSELLQSQLLQPININPVQPHLAESNLFILEGAGPSDLSFNEYNPLFNRNRYALQLSGVAGGESTLGDEIAVSTVQGKVSLSAGQFHFETQGFRNNNDQKQDIYNLFAQVALSPQTSVQAEFRARDFKHGDLQVLFDPENFLPDLRETEHIRSIRLGVHHSFSPNSDFIGSVIYRTSDLDSDLPDVHIGTEEDGILVEMQHLYRTEQLNVISGAGLFDNHLEETDIISGDISKAKSNSHQGNLYVYSQVNYFRNVTLTLGGSADFFKGQIADKTLKHDQFNPKFGITWNPTSGTTLRAAVFRTLKRSLLTDQTVEPTQVAGFNQFFDDAEGTKAWRYGLGVDQKISDKLYGGAELSKRDLNVPGIKFNEESFTMNLIEADWEEQLGRAYIYWTPHPWLSLSTEYQFERLERPREFAAENITRLNTQRLLFGIDFFHPSGFIARLKPTYVAQDGKFLEGPPFDLRVVSKEDQFWVFDASIGYRLPKRFGIITITGKNLFNKKFNFQDTDPSNPTIQPKQLIIAKFTLAF